jgi:3-hydroxyacyl-CoA dehydrogenase
MKRLKPDVDIVLDILKEVAAAFPENAFAQSILFQYQERGGLSKKQLQGLYDKAQKVKNISAAKLATLEAIILKKPLKDKAPPPRTAGPLYQKDEETGNLIESILKRASEHKRVLFLKSKYDNNETLTGGEKEELRKFDKLLK